MNPLRQRGPVWTPITPKTGALFHADSQIDARECDIDAYRSLVICGPMVAVGPMKAWRVDGSHHALSSLEIADYAPVYAAIGAIVHNRPAPTGEPEAIAA